MKICFNGKFYDEDEGVLPINNRSYKWGDGLFETIKVYNGKILLDNYHLDRLFLGLRVLQIHYSDADFSAARLHQLIHSLVNQNGLTLAARVRLAVFRNENNTVGFTIEATALKPGHDEWNKEGQTIGLYPYARKSLDVFSGLKTANYLPYVMAARYAEQNNLDDVLLLNSNNNICDSTRANVFLVFGRSLYTPPLHEGCVQGVMRRVLLDQLPGLGYTIQQKVITEEDLLKADEVFLTNALQLLRWVRQYKNSRYTNSNSKIIFDSVAATIY